MEIGDTSEEAMNINETTTESVEVTEPDENAENTEKLGKSFMVPDISFFTLAVENLHLNCDQCNITNSSKKELTQRMSMKQCSSKDFRHYHFNFAVRFIKKNRRNSPVDDRPSTNKLHHFF